MPSPCGRRPPPWRQPHGGRGIGSSPPARKRHRAGRQEESTRLSAGVPLLVHLASMFTGAPRVVRHEQAGAGHDTGDGRTALAHHPHAPILVKECAPGVRALPTEKRTWRWVRLRTPHCCSYGSCSVG
ncbi:hypothetical protein [Streptomyces sp. NPDC058295]|uniref:hypothetical protein n=1 Tax=Streptomyces sp. NPDC058295 TaxID=3346431 RepID=UPI0036EBCE43